MDARIESCHVQSVFENHFPKSSWVQGPEAMVGLKAFIETIFTMDELPKSGGPCAACASEKHTRFFHVSFCSGRGLLFWEVMETV